MVPVCDVGGEVAYGSEMEALAAKLKAGDRIVFAGRDEVVDYVWFYDGIIIRLRSGQSVHPALGDVFSHGHTATCQ